MARIIPAVLTSLIYIEEFTPPNKKLRPSEIALAPLKGIAVLLSPFLVLGVVAFAYHFWPN
jgi:hypothetical protein